MLHPGASSWLSAGFFRRLRLAKLFMSFSAPGLRWRRLWCRSSTKECGEQSGSDTRVTLGSHSDVVFRGSREAHLGSD